MIQSDGSRQESHSDLTLMYTKEADKSIMPPEEYREKMYSLNNGQKEIMMFLRHWIKETVVRHKHSLPAIPFRIALMGSGGTGKSHVISLFERDMLHFSNIAKLTESGQPVVLLTAPTGVASFNINGLTLHSALGISQFNLSSEKQNIIRDRLGNILAVVCDENSMIGHKLFDKMNDRLCFVKDYEQDSGVQFGNVSILSTGDPYQLGPVYDTPVYKPIKDPKKPEHLAPLKWHSFQMHELTEIMRQKDDQDWARVLNKIRTCGPKGIKQGSEEDLMLKSRELTLEESHPDYPTDLLHVYARNQEADIRNAKRLRELEGPVFKSHARFSANVNLETLNIPDDRSQTGNLPKLVELKIGARVKIPVNIDNKDGLSNGVMGTVTEVILKPRTDDIEVVFVKFDSERIGTNARQNKRFKRRTDKSVPITRTEVMFFLGKKKNIEAHVSQIPLVLAHGVTIHCTQSLTLNGIVVDMREGSFKPGQAYVAFSRVTKLCGLHIIGYDYKKIRSSQEVDEEMERLRKHPIPKLPEPLILGEEIQLSIGHLNIVGLISKQKYLLKDPLYQSMVMCFSETRIPPSTPNDKLPFPTDFEISRNDRNEDGGGVLVCAHPKTKPSCVTLKQSPIEAAALRISHPQELVVMCVYKPPTMGKGFFIKHLLDLLQPFQQKPLVLTGDFNEDLLHIYWDEAFDSPHPNPSTEILDTLVTHGFTQLITEATYEHGSLLDHIYVRNVDIDGSDVQDVYFSDHSSVYCFQKQS